MQPVPAAYPLPNQLTTMGSSLGTGWPRVRFRRHDRPHLHGKWRLQRLRRAASLVSRSGPDTARHPVPIKPTPAAVPALPALPAPIPTLLSNSPPSLQPHVLSNSHQPKQPRYSQRNAHQPGTPPCTQWRCTDPQKPAPPLVPSPPTHSPPPGSQSCPPRLGTPNLSFHLPANPLFPVRTFVLDPGNETQTCRWARRRAVSSPPRGKARERLSDRAMPGAQSSLSTEEAGSSASCRLGEERVFVRPGSARLWTRRR